MSFIDIFWIFLIITALQPVLQRHLIGRARLEIMRRLQRQRGSRVIVMVHRQETMSLLGFPIVRYIDIDDSEEILRAIRLTPDEMPIDLILHTPGRAGPGGRTDRPGPAGAQRQGDGARTALRHVREHPHRAGRRRDHHGRARGARAR